MVTIKKNLKFIFFLLIFLFIIQIIFPVVIASDPAEVNVFVNGKLPNINVNEWTPIELTIEDRFGIDYLKLKEFPKILIELWKFNKAFPQPIKRFLGPTSFKFEAFSKGGEDSGWNYRFDPNIIHGSFKGDSFNFTMYVKVDDSTANYQNTVIINCTRIDALGWKSGYSWIPISLKVKPKSYLSVSDFNQILELSPKSLTNFSFNLTNSGYYRNIFYLESKTYDEQLYALIHNQAVVIDSNETHEINLSILTPEKFIDFGTVYIIDVYGAHCLNSTFIKLGSLTIVNKGMYLSPLLILIIILFAIFTLFFTLVLRKILFKFQQYKFGRPNQPWNIPEEKSSLKKLKRVDRKKYIELKNLMKEEYQSSIYWFKSYRKQMKKLEK